MESSVLIMKLVKCSLPLLANVRKLQTSSLHPVREISIPVPWGKISGKWWGSTSTKPIITVHGLQDNCGTFDRLIPLLRKDASFLAIDLPGHGYSTRIPRGMTYEIVPTCLIFKRIMDYYKWPTVAFMAHSVGSMICYQFASAYMDKMDFIICLDAFKCVKEPATRKLIREWMDRHLKFEEIAEKGLEPPCYTLEELNKKVAVAYHDSIRVEYCHYINSRNIAPSKIHPGKYYLTRDPMLNSPIVLLSPQSQEEILEDAKIFSIPMFFCKTPKHTYLEEEYKTFEVLDVIRSHNKNCEFHRVKGTHHAHLNEPEEIAGLINNFLDKYHKVEDSNLDENNAIFIDPKNAPQSN